MLMRAATVVHVLHGLFYVLLQLLVVAAILLTFKFYCSYDPSLSGTVDARRGRSGLTTSHVLASEVLQSPTGNF